MRSIRPLNIWKLEALRASLYVSDSSEESYILRITGSGELKLGYDAEVPWNEYSDKITELQLSEHIKYTDLSALTKLRALRCITLVNDIKNTVSELITGKSHKIRYFSDGAALFSISDTEAALLIFASGSKTTYSLPAAIRYAECRYPVTEIADDAFRSSDITDVRLSGCLRHIGNDSFRDCKRLRNVLFGTSLFKLGDNAFSGCTSITSLSLPCRLETVPQYAFSNCTSLSSVSLPKGVKSIERNAFSGCSSLFRIELPKKLQYIDTDAFADCRNLIEIKNNSSITLNAGDDTNGGIARYAISIYSDGVDGNRLTVDGSGYIFTLNDGTPMLVRYIGKETELSLPKCSPLSDSPYTIAPRAFAARNDILTVTIPKGVSSVGDGAFSECTSLKNVTIMDGAERIAPRAFADCTSLEELHLGAALKKIDASAFNGCASLSRITVAPENPGFSSDGKALFEAGSSSSAGCSLLLLADSASEDYSVPEKMRFGYITQRVTKISSYAISENSKLSTLTITRNVSYICSYAICAPLKKLIFNGNAKKWKAVRKGNNWLGNDAADAAPSMEYTE